jgi:hypothetical protein
MKAEKGYFESQKCAIREDKKNNLLLSILFLKGLHTVLSKLQSIKKIEIIDNLIDIAEIFVAQFGIDANTIMSYLIMLFPPAKDLKEIISAPLGEIHIFIIDLTKNHS